MPTKRMVYLVACLLSLAWAGGMLMGCQTTTSKPVAVLPTYQWVNGKHAMSLVNQRASSIDSIFAAGHIALIAPGKQVGENLEMAVVVLGDHRLRLRAWKLKQPVLDVTYTPDGLWVWTDGQVADAFFNPPSLDELIEALRGKVPLGAVPVQEDEHGLTVAQRWEAKTASAGNTGGGAVGGVVQVLIDKATLTVRQYRYLDDQGRVHQAMTLNDYDILAYLPWPTRLTVQGDDGSLQMSFADVQINTALPEGAFVPYSKAKKK